MCQCYNGVYLPKIEERRRRRPHPLTNWATAEYFNLLAYSISSLYNVFYTAVLFSQGIVTDDDNEARKTFSSCLQQVVVIDSSTLATYPRRPQLEANKLSLMMCGGGKRFCPNICELLLFSFS